MAKSRHRAALPRETEHPYIIRVEGVCGGRPVIKRTRISVRHIAELYRHGDTVDEILKDHPHLSGAAVHDAISYYFDHQKEIDQEIEDNRFKKLSAKTGIEIGKRGFVRLAKKTPPK